MLAVVEALCGADFVPAYYGSYVYKQPGTGVGFSYHPVGLGRAVAFDTAAPNNYVRASGRQWMAAHAKR
jgi:hypothetical protein